MTTIKNNILSFCEWFTTIYLGKRPEYKSFYLQFQLLILINPQQFVTNVHTKINKISVRYNTRKMYSKMLKAKKVKTNN